jgi:outer membrane lipoprotein LolB
MALAALAAAALASCATVPPEERRRPTFVPAPDAPFALSGRLSARRGNDGIAANVRWNHAPDADELMFATPLGAALARLDGTRERVRLTLADGGTAEAADWESLTTRVVGAPLPVRGLAWWIRASPRPGSEFAAEADAQQRLEVLRQDGWEIVYAYREGDTRPMRLTLAYPGVEVRLVVDGWQP